MSELQIKLDELQNEKAAKLKPEYLKDGHICMGVLGTLKEGVDTSDATATSADITVGTSAYVNGEKVEGTLAKRMSGSVAETSEVEHQSAKGLVVLSNPSTARYESGAKLGTQESNIANAIGLTPEKLVAGNTVLGVEGTAITGGGSDEQVKLFSTVEEMNGSENNEEGDLAVVYSDELKPITADYIFSEVIFPDTVVLPQAVTDSVYVNFTAIDYDGWMDANASLDPWEFSFGCFGESDVADIRYFSDDGVTYNRMERTADGQFSWDGNKLVLGIDFRHDENSDWNDEIGNFMIVGGSMFGGLYTYDGESYKIAKTQLTATAQDVFNQRFYGENGVEKGALGTTVSTTFADVSAQLYTQIQKLYDDLEPITLDDSTYSSAIPENALIVPSKLNGDPILDTSNLTTTNNMFASRTKLLYVHPLDTRQVTDMTGMFYMCEQLRAVPKLNYDSVTTTSSMFLGCYNIECVDGLDLPLVTDATSMFSSCNRLKRAVNLNMPNVNTMKNMFQFTDVDEVSFVNTDSVTNLESAFYGANIKSVPGLNTSNVTTMFRAFSGCQELLDISNLNTPRVTTFRDAFYNCQKLADVPVLDTSSATNMDYMFYNCNALTDDSLNNIMTMCINAPIKETLSYVGLWSSQVERCKALSNYQAFLDAGWTA